MDSEVESLNECSHKINGTLDNRKISKKQNIPPIYITTDNLKSLTQILSNIFESTQFTVKQLTNSDKSTHVIFARDLSKFDEIKNKLKTEKVEYYTYTPKGEKSKLLVLKGLNETFAPEEVKQELQKAVKDIAVIEKIDTLKTKNNTNSKCLLIQFSSDSDTSKISKIKTIAYQVVRWKTFKKPSVFQCFNCQRVGHSSKNCNLSYRCVKCTETHPRGLCKIKKDQGQPTCVNCQGNHPANYRGCNYIKEAQEKRNAIKTRTTEKRLSLTNSNRIHNHSTQSNIHIKPNNNSPINKSQNYQNIQTNPKTTELTDLKNIITSFQTQITQAFQNQNIQLDNFKTQLITKIDNNSSKIDFLYNHLNLQWPAINQ